MSVDPAEAVALGAAIHAGVLLGEVGMRGVWRACYRRWISACLQGCWCGGLLRASTHTSAMPACAPALFLTT